ncbi:hypothetical protein LTR05_002358 [Lithohypha guttulata]|uniref:ADP-ribosylhydrolase ARH3 n=1 Tax=Lithohypha guttulata TaxID=1690604 RepID=A0AAN7YHY6_9EURO|nr:hypothetical protein LTR05_002358 [Lithohypha guttulata]
MSTQSPPDLPSRIRTAFYGLATCDALGAPLEFQPRIMDSSQYVRDMLPNSNFSLPAGHFTDDTSMALCLAHSLISKNGAHDPLDQAARYVKWLDEGYMSSVAGYAFDVGNQTRQSLQYYRKKPELSTLEFVTNKFNEDWRCGNGSLMRVLPCALVARTEEEAVELGKRSSQVTHPHRRCVHACALYCALVFRALRGASKGELALCIREWLAKAGEDIDPEIRARLAQYESLEMWQQMPREKISSSGYVLDSLEAALWAFFITNTFEEGAIEVVNLGDDADTVGAIFGGLAGAWYGDVSCISDRWLVKMQEVQLVNDVVKRITSLHE